MLHSAVFGKGALALKLPQHAPADVDRHAHVKKAMRCSCLFLDCFFFCFTAADHTFPQAVRLSLAFFFINVSTRFGYINYAQPFIPQHRQIGKNALMVSQDLCYKVVNGYPLIASSCMEKMSPFDGIPLCQIHIQCCHAKISMQQNWLKFLQFFEQGWVTRHSNIRQHALPHSKQNYDKKNYKPMHSASCATLPECASEGCWRPPASFSWPPWLLAQPKSCIKYVIHLLQS